MPVSCSPWPARRRREWCQQSWAAWSGGCGPTAAFRRASIDRGSISSTTPLPSEDPQTHAQEHSQHSQPQNKHKNNHSSKWNETSLRGFCAFQNCTTFFSPFFRHVHLVFLISNDWMRFPASFLQHFHICSRDEAGRVLFPTVLCQLVAHSAAFLRKLATRRRNWHWFLFSRQNSLFLPSALFSSDQNVKQDSRS